MKLLVLLLLCSTLAQGAESPLSGLIGTEEPTEKNGKNDNGAPATPPHPAKLTANWVRFFDVGPGVLDQRIDPAVRLLNSVLEELTGDEKREAGLRVTRIAENLRAIVEARKTAASEVPPARPIQDRYTLSEWLDIVHKRRTIQAELHTEKEDLQRTQKRLEAARQHLDSLTAAYLTLSAQAQERLARGLEIMAAWSDNAVSGERLRLQKAALLVHQKQLEQLTEKVEAAQERLFVSTLEQQRLGQELETAERELDRAHDTASRLATTPVPGNIDTEEGKAQALLFEQRLRHSSIKEAIADAVLTRKKLELDLVRLQGMPDAKPPEGLRKRLQEALDHIGDFATKVEVWREEAERDQGRAGKSLAGLFGTSGQQNAELVKITQQRLSEAQDTLLSLQKLDAEIHDAKLIADTLRSRVIAREGALKSGLETVKTSSVKVWDLVWENLQASLFKIGETPVTVLGILRVVLIVTLAWALSHFVRRGLSHFGELQRGTSTFLYSLGRLAHYLILIVGISIGLSSIGIDLSNFALIAGALSLGIGFGLQAIVSNFVSGLIVLFERSLRVGDFVELSSGVAGEVRAVNVRSTLVTTPDMVDILVPNSEFVNGKVINWTLTDASRRIHIPFGVAYGSDKERVRQAALEAAEHTPYTLRGRHGREPQVWLTSFGESSLDFELVVWVMPSAVKKPNLVRAAYNWELETALAKYGLEIPFPQRDIHVRSGLHPLPSAPGDTQPSTDNLGEENGNGH